MKEWQEELEVTQDGMHERRKARWKDWKRKEKKRLPLFPSLIRRGLWVGRPVQRRPWRTAWTLGPCRCSAAATAPPGSRCGRRDTWWAAPGWDSASPPPLGWLRREGEGRGRTVSVRSRWEEIQAARRLRAHRETGRRHRRQRSGTALAPAPTSACGTDWHRGSSRRWWGSRTWWRWSARQIPGWSLPAGGERKAIKRGCLLSLNCR